MAGRDLHPLDDEQGFMKSSHTSFLLDQPCLVAPNIWQSDRVARIDPESGAVTGWLDLAPITERERRAGEVDVANGIAWGGRRLYVTGKLWRSVYGLELLR